MLILSCIDLKDIITDKKNLLKHLHALIKYFMLMIYEMNHMWTAEMKWNEEMIVTLNAIYAIA